MIFVLVAFIICLPLVVFALSNTQMVTLGFWPTDYTVDMHLSLAILIAMAVALFVGGLLVWFPALGDRHRATRAERMVQELEAQIEDLKKRQSSNLPR
jgi:uncharacterized integral membrane protein